MCIRDSKPGGSIKIRVKTYAHSLKLHEERLADHREKKAELMLNIDKKRHELLTMKKEQLAARKQSDPALEAQLAELADKIRAYEAPKRAPEAPKGLVLLGKKRVDGAIERIAPTEPRTPVSGPKPHAPAHDHHQHEHREHKDHGIARSIDLRHDDISPAEPTVQEIHIPREQVAFDAED